MEITFFCLEVKLQVNGRAKTEFRLMIWNLIQCISKVQSIQLVFFPLQITENSTGIGVITKGSMVLWDRKSRWKVWLTVHWLSNSASSSRNQVSHHPKAPLLFSGESGSRSAGKRKASLLPTTAELLKKGPEACSDGITYKPLLHTMENMH